MVMKQVSKIIIAELNDMAQKMYGTLVKAVIDIEKNAMVVDAELHADEEAYLLEHGSKQKDLWGINLYPAKFGTDDFIEYDSMINIRPSQNNMTRGVEDKTTRETIIKIVSEKVTK